MDRPIDADVQRRRTLRRAGTITAVVALAGGRARLAARPRRPSISRASVRTSIADAGPIEAVITATGTVVPEVEQVVSSPVDARVLHILKRTGRG